jgi:hypothetical protein
VPHSLWPEHRPGREGGAAGRHPGSIRWQRGYVATRQLRPERGRGDEFSWPDRLVLGIRVRRPHGQGGRGLVSVLPHPVLPAAP